MSSKEVTSKSREDVIAAREAKKLAKQNSKAKPSKSSINNPAKLDHNPIPESPQDSTKLSVKNETASKGDTKFATTKGTDEVDKAAAPISSDVITKDTNKSKDQIKAERAAKKLAKQTKKKPILQQSEHENAREVLTKATVAETLSSIVDVAKEVQDVTAKVKALLLKMTAEKQDDSNETAKSKADLRAERRAKQEAQRAAKMAAQQNKPKSKPETKVEAKTVVKADTLEKPLKTKTLVKAKSKSLVGQKLIWFQHLHVDEDAQTEVSLNSNLHPAIIKLGVQLASRVITGANARCIALLDALKKMISDFTVPARGDVGRTLEAALSAHVAHVWARRPPGAAQLSAVQHLRHQMARLPHAVAELDAKKILHEEIDRYIREQIDMAGEAISIAVRDKISNGDVILTYGYSSLIERILREAHAAGVQFSCVVVAGQGGGAGELRRRLTESGVPCRSVPLAALSLVMRTVNKVVVGAASVLATGAVLAAAGTAQVALAARRHNVPTLVCCETHKFSERAQLDALSHNELVGPQHFNHNESGKDVRSSGIPVLHLQYDVTPPSLVTAVVTELAILPCTSAPVVLRFKLSEYGI